MKTTDNKKRLWKQLKIVYNNDDNNDDEENVKIDE